MNRKIIIGLACFAVAIQLNAQHQVRGTVKSLTGENLQGASIAIVEEGRGTISIEDGSFLLDDVPGGEHRIQISYLGYETVEINRLVEGSTNLGVVELIATYFQGEEVTISALLAGDKTPMAFTDMSKQEIAEQNFGQDIPYIVGLTPSMVTSSDAGHGVGYTSMRIRGTDANRINVTINGVPLNDAESQSVFWVDLPDLASSAEQLQIQRGVGTSTNGAAAFGATVNMQTTSMNKDAYANYDLTAGSFNTFRNSISAGTGLINDRFAVDLRISDLNSDGYIDRSWTDLQSYYISAALYGDKSSLKFISFGGFEELYQSWGGVPSSLLETNRTYNEMGEYTDSTGNTAYYDRQIDHYDQTHYQLHYSKEISPRIELNTALHYTIGDGYYEQYETDEDYGYYSMVAPVIGGETVASTDLVRRKWLHNDFGGVIASLKYDDQSSTAIIGGGYNRYFGTHFGRVMWAEFMGENEIGHEYYHGTGDKSDWNIYGKYYHYLSSKLTVFADMQLRGIIHDIAGTDAQLRDVTQKHSFLFFNPKAGITYEPSAGQRAFISYARANREPNRNNYTDAPAGMSPVQETLNDYEAGYSFSGSGAFAGVTLYFMDYTDQLVLTGEINEVGYPVMTNVTNSYRAGIELEAAYNWENKIIWQGNLSLSKNEIKDFVNYIDNWDYWNDPETEVYQVEESFTTSSLAYSPSIVTASSIRYNIWDDLHVSLVSKYVSKQYIDNSSNEAYKIDPYFVNDLKLTYSIQPSWADKLIFSVLIPNLLDVDYETNAWLYRYYSGGQEAYLDGYFPQAGRYFMLGLSLNF